MRWFCLIPASIFNPTTTVLLCFLNVSCSLFTAYANIPLCRHSVLLLYWTVVLLLSLCSCEYCNGDKECKGKQHNVKETKLTTGITCLAFLSPLSVTLWEIIIILVLQASIGICPEFLKEDRVCNRGRVPQRQSDLQPR